LAETRYDETTGILHIDGANLQGDRAYDLNLQATNLEDGKNQIKVYKEFTILTITPSTGSTSVPSSVEVSNANINLLIPVLVVKTEDATLKYFSVALESVAGTNPPRLKVTAASPPFGGPGIQVVTSTTTLSFPSGGNKAASVSCPQGMNALGGGAQNTGGGGEVLLNGSWPCDSKATGWCVTYYPFNSAATTATVVTYAICAYSAR